MYRILFQQGIFAHYDVSLLKRLIDSRKNVFFLFILIEFISSESFKAIWNFQNWYIRWKWTRKPHFFANQWAYSVLRRHNEQKCPVEKKIRYTFAEWLPNPDFRRNVIKFCSLTPNWLHFIMLKVRDDWLNISKDFGESRRGSLFLDTLYILWRTSWQKWTQLHSRLSL